MLVSGTDTSLRIAGRVPLRHAGLVTLSISRQELVLLGPWTKERYSLVEMTGRIYCFYHITFYNPIADG